VYLTNDSTELISASVSTVAGSMWVGLHYRSLSSKHSLVELETVLAKQDLS